MKTTSPRMFALAAILLSAGLFCLLPANATLAAGACPDTARAAADGPQPQDTEAVLAADRTSVTATTKIAPCPQRYTDVEVSFSLFDSDGVFLNMTPQGPPPDPQTVRGIIAIDPAWADRLLKKVLVGVMWEDCPVTGGTDCADKAWHFKSYLIDVPSLTPSARR